MASQAGLPDYQIGGNIVSVRCPTGKEDYISPQSADRALKHIRRGRRHASELVDHMLRKQGRAATGAAGVLRSFSALMKDAITQDLAGANPF